MTKQEKDFLKDMPDHSKLFWIFAGVTVILVNLSLHFFINFTLCHLNAKFSISGILTAPLTRTVPVHSPVRVRGPRALVICFPTYLGPLLVKVRVVWPAGPRS